MTKEAMIAEIIIAVRANRVPVTGDMLLALAFRTEGELRRICAELHIRTD